MIYPSLEQATLLVFDVRLEVMALMFVDSTVCTSSTRSKLYDSNIPTRHTTHSIKWLSMFKGILEQLELPYRILRLCGGDLGFTAALTYDFEIYSTAQERWLEVSSVSNFESYQSTRLKLRFKDKEGNRQWVHTLNGSALALATYYGGTLLENNQSENGIRIPEALVLHTLDLIRFT